MGLVDDYWRLTDALWPEEVRLYRRDRPWNGPYVSIGPDGYVVEACVWVDGRPTQEQHAVVVDVSPESELVRTRSALPAARLDTTEEVAEERSDRPTGGHLLGLREEVASPAGSGAERNLELEGDDQ
ncbi:MAG: hypothetical protein V3U45_04205 [bacterium]